MKMQPKTYTVGELLKLHENKMLAANPEYQRGLVWTIAQKKRLIDSVLRGYPIPLFYLNYIKRDVSGHQREDFEVIDGQQRLNSLYDFKEGAFKLFDPKKDKKEARFPAFIQAQPCQWGNKDFSSLEKDIQNRFLETKLSVVLVETSDSNEARDLFIRLQAGMPLNAQEKRDAWPGNFTEFVLKVGGKPEIARYPGHDFFKLLMGAKSGKSRGKFRQVCAQLVMLYLNRRENDAMAFCDINSRSIDDFYYTHLGFDHDSIDAKRFTTILQKLTDLLGDKKRKRILNHEAIHLTLLLDTLWDDYTRSWEEHLSVAFDNFRENLVKDKKDKEGEFWLRYGQLTRTNSDRADTIRRRHEFFVEKMIKELKLSLKDSQRVYGPLERELIYYRDKKKCKVCNGDVQWPDADVHHVQEHSKGGPTSLENGVLVHSHCHPKGDDAREFEKNYITKLQ